MLLAFEVSATSIKAHQVLITHDNANEFGFSLKNEYKESSKTCTNITINKYHRKVEQYGLFIEIQSSQGQPVLSSKIAAYPNKNNDLVNYSFCYQNYDVVVTSVVAYGYQANGLITAYMDISSELIAP